MREKDVYRAGEGASDGHSMPGVTRPRRAPAGKRAPGGKKPKGGLSAGRIVLRVLGVVLVMLVSVAGLIYGAVGVLCKGPSQSAKEQFVVTVNQTSMASFLAELFLSDEEIQAILDSNQVLPPTGVTDVTKPFEPPPEDKPHEDIEIIDVTGSTFRGKMMIIYDPSRVQLETLDAFGSEIRGKRIEDFAAEYEATAAINGGFFDDPGGVGKGGQPLGLLIKDGVIVNGSTGMVSTICGFTEDNHLFVGEVSGQDALEKHKIRDCVALAPNVMPPLIIDEKVAEFTGSGSGLNPRTAIGQRADGAVLMLVIDGRQPHSIGASPEDCLNLMLEYEAINASMLDGGSSSVMVYQGETINVCSSLYGSRSQPAAWLVY